MQRLTFLLLLYIICIVSYSMAQDKAELKTLFLDGDYSRVINDYGVSLSGEKMDASMEELYILGLSYFKEGDYPLAEKAFNTVINDSKAGAFHAYARMSLADTYLFQNEYDKAILIYRSLLGASSEELGPALYYRLGLCQKQSGQEQESKGYFDELKKLYPDSLEALQAKVDGFEKTSLSYTIQVGAFSDRDNALKLKDKLIAQGHLAYIEESGIGSGPLYRVRVGSFTSRKAAVELSSELSRNGYSVKIFP